MYGKQKENRKAGQKFSEWVQETFPGLGGNDTADAIWFAEKSGTLPEIPPGLTSPILIRRWFNTQQAAQALPEDLLAIAPAAALSLPQRDAEKVAKVIQRAASGDEGSATAKRHVEGMARKHGVSVEALAEAAKNGAPDTTSARQKSTTSPPAST